MQKAYAKWLADNELLLHPMSRAELCQFAFEGAWKICNPEETIPYAEIVESMNTALERKFKVTPTTKKLIHARWKEGFREADFVKVCEIKKSVWDDDPKMWSFLRPETLFGTKMNSYLQEKGKAIPDRPDWT